MNTLRIALLTHSVNPRGGVVHTLELANALSALGHEVTVFVPAAQGEKLFRLPVCRVVYAPITLHRDSTVAMVEARIAAFTRALIGHGVAAFDVLHAQDSISGNALAALKDRGCIADFIRTVHHLDDFGNPRLAAWQRRAYEAADQVLCVSDTWTQRMHSVDGINATTVPNGVDVTRFTRSSDACDAQMTERCGLGSGPIVLSVGGIEARKNTLTSLDAFALLRRTYRNAQWVIAGGASLLDHDAYADRFFKRARELDMSVGPRGSIVVTGSLEDAVMPALFRCADVLSMVSLREGFGLVVLEALASGTPVVVSAIAPFTEYLDDSTCYWADPASVGSVAVALARAIDNSAQGIDFEHAVPALLARFSWAASARRHLDAYRLLLARRALTTH